LIPTFWKYILKNYLKIFFLSLSSFIALLLVTRLKEIARFTSLCIEKSDVIYFTAYQIPYILPLAIPISSLIATLLLFTKMSQTHELTALRSSGLTLFQISRPILFLGAFGTLINFMIVSELSPRTRLQAKNILFEESSINPIELLQREELLRIKGSYVDMKPSKKNPERAKDIYYIYRNRKSNRLNLCMAKKLHIQQDQLLADQVTFITFLPSTHADTLLVENQSKLSSPASHLSKMMKKGTRKLTYNYLPFRILLASHKLENKRTSIFAEIARRAAFGLSVFSFTFIGIGFGVDIGRKISRKKILVACLFASAIMATFALGKSLRHYTFLSILIYILPQLLSIYFANRALKRRTIGIE